MLNDWALDLFQGVHIFWCFKATFKQPFLSRLKKWQHIDRRTTQRRGYRPWGTLATCSPLPDLLLGTHSLPPTHKFSNTTKDLRLWGFWGFVFCLGYSPPILLEGTQLWEAAGGRVTWKPGTSKAVLKTFRVPVTAPNSIWCKGNFIDVCCSHERQGGPLSGRNVQPFLPLLTPLQRSQ